MIIEEHPNTTAKEPYCVQDGEWFTIMKDGDKPGLWGCCDCGLMHRIELKFENNEIFLKVYRDIEATQIRRDAMFEGQR